MDRWKAGVVACLILAGCGSDGKLIETVPAPEVPSTTVELTTTTTAAPEPTTVPATTTTEPDDEPTVSLVPIPTTVRVRATTTTAPAAREYLREEATTGACGGSLPPCYVMARESGGDIHVYNYSGSGASGKWQFMPGTWNGYGGYANAADAPESVQDEKARQLWANGAGCWHWDAC